MSRTKWALRGGVVVSTVVVLLGGLEGYARSQALDLRQGSAIAATGREVQHQAEGRFDPTGDWGVAYLPRGLTEGPAGFTTPWGSCSLDWSGRTVLVLGDSVTRQATPGPHTHGGTWPMQLTWPEDVQVCVLAEDGYHPAEYAAMADKVRRDGLEPDLTLIVLCENDVQDLPARYPVQLDGRVALYEPPTHTLAWAPAWQPWLYAHSEAFRFAHWRLAVANPDQAAQIPATVTQRDVSPALLALQDAGPTEIWFLPPLRVQDDPLSSGRLENVNQTVSGIRVLDRGTDPASLRRQPDDHVHLNDAGHAWIAAQIQPVVDDALN
jgi:lysophospholipase L1-like esterase